MPSDLVTKQDLIDAKADALDLKDVVNGSASLNGTGTVSTRYGGERKTLGKLQAEFEAQINAQVAALRYFPNVAAGVAGVGVGSYFSSPDAVTGALRIYLRTGTSPFFIDQGDGVAPLTRTSLRADVGISVDSLGAAGSPLVNDATAINAANALATALGGRVIFSKPTYWTGPITIPDNVSWISRSGSSIRPHSSTAAGATLITLGSNHTFTKITFEDPSNVLSGEDSIFLNGNSTEDIDFLSCYFQDMLARSVRISNFTNVRMLFCTARRNRPHAQLLDERSTDFYFVDNMDGLTVNFCNFEGLDTSGVPWGSREIGVLALAVTSGTIATNVSIQWNSFKNYRRSFIVAGSDWEINSFKPLSGYFSVSGNKGQVCGMQAIKWKGAVGHDMSDNTMRGPERICHEVPDSLRGCYFLQITPETTFNNNKAIGDPVRLWQGNVVAATSTTVTLPNPPAGTWRNATFSVSGGGTPNSMVGKLLFIRSGTGAYQWRRITNYVPATNVATVAAWSTTPNATSVVEVWNNPSAGYIIRGNNGNSPVWVTGTAYVPGDIVITNNNVYICDLAHTSGTFATDLAALLWRVIDSADTRTANGFMGGVNYVEDCEVAVGLSGPMYSSNLGSFVTQNCAVPLRTYDPPAWATAQSYVAGDFVHTAGRTYLCAQSHTSGTFSTDLTANLWRQRSYFRDLSFDSFSGRYFNYPNPLGTTSVALSFIDVLRFGNLVISGAYRDVATFNNITGLTISAGRLEGAGQGRGDAGVTIASRNGASFNSVRGQITNFTLGGANAGAQQSFGATFQETNYPNHLLFMNCDLTGNASASASSSGALNGSFMPGEQVLFSQTRGVGAQPGVLSMSNAPTTWFPTLSGSVVLLNVPITADRTLTLNTSGPVEGQEVVIRRTVSSTGAFNLVVAGALEAITLATGQTARLRYSVALTGWVRVA